MVFKNSEIAKNVKYYQDLFFGDFSVCKENVIIGKNVKIFSQVYVGENVIIGNNVIIHPGVKISIVKEIKKK